MVDQQFGQLQRTFDLHFGVRVPRSHATAVFVLGEHHITGCVFLAEPRYELVSHAAQSTGVVHFDADRRLVQTHESVPLAHPSMPGDDVKWQ